MSRDDRHRCPPWCVADHPAEDDGHSPARHRSETVVVPGIAIRGGARRTVESIEILIEVHAEEGDPVVGVYVGDGADAGLDLTTETAERLVRRRPPRIAMPGTTTVSLRWRAAAPASSSAAWSATHHGGHLRRSSRLMRLPPRSVPAE